MPRVECVLCKRLLSGYEFRSYAVEFAYCDRCHRGRIHRLESLVGSLQAAQQRLRDEERRLQAVARQAEFLRAWDQDTLDLPLSDVTLKACDGPDVCAHKAILAPLWFLFVCLFLAQAGKSPVFKAMFSAQMKEAQSGVVRIDDFSHDVLEAFVRFFYTATVCPEVLKKHAASLFCAAEKYGVKLLKAVCEEFLVSNVSRDNAINLLDLARKYDSETVKDAVLRTASMDMQVLPTFGDYSMYAEKDPKLLVELYEGLVKRMSRKRSRIVAGNDGQGDSSRAKIAAIQRNEEEVAPGS
ncbi:BTB/POZ domain-containing protein At4g08455 [Selaginella moellendorffii]|uniref:BTB/POZ domain-containing protein At4g08455 n=1 Tax=Selaginella moellendorffii TaxID=88036 RepID=UPI000D1C3DC7|nr:BTB/POZ domain-containing protein At4g08455 [Selaginella moellendorffii]|eukprot:XP_002987220.2 BTB/POZ domain-containing protein At4g08455 [Selaginella moellendorffii]